MLIPGLEARVLPTKKKLMPNTARVARLRRATNFNVGKDIVRTAKITEELHSLASLANELVTEQMPTCDTGTAGSAPMR